jgi:hypothetical protein
MEKSTQKPVHADVLKKAVKLFVTSNLIGKLFPAGAPPCFEPSQNFIDLCSAEVKIEFEHVVTEALEEMNDVLEEEIDG